VLLAAGFDYNAQLAPVLWDIGFAGQEVGSVTAQKCIGNPPPNLKRLIRSQSIQVFKGLKNDGVEEIIKRIKKMDVPSSFVLGVSIAKTNNEECANEDEAIKDYVYSYNRLNEEGVGHFYTINISCPNAFGGEDFAKPEPLRKLLIALKKLASTKPLYFKMPINKSWEDFKELLDLLEQYKVHGVVIGNLNKDYKSIDFQEELPTSEFRGGLSGKPCQKLSNDLIRKTRAAFPAMTIMGCGGVLTVEDAKDKLEAGANLVQMISGMIFNGPHVVNDINMMFKRMN
jgi:dihydroorotate dehydrogenase